MCESCLAGCELLGEVVPGLFLLQATKDFQHITAGFYGLTRSNGPEVVWEIKPTPDPCEGLSDDEINARTDSRDFEWFDDVALFTCACQEQLQMGDSFQIGLLCQAAGYDPVKDGHLEHWLFHRMGVLLSPKE